MNLSVQYCDQYTIDVVTAPSVNAWMTNQRGCAVTASTMTATNHAMTGTRAFVLMASRVEHSTHRVPLIRQDKSFRSDTKQHPPLGKETNVAHNPETAQ